MTYDVTKVIEEIAEIEKVSAAKIAEELGIKESVCGGYIAWNRGEESKVEARLDSLKKSIKKNAMAKEVKSTYHWVQDEEGWAVAGDFTGKNEDDEVIVMKADGTKHIKMIKNFSASGNAYVY